MKVVYNALNILGRNGWSWLTEDEHIDYYVFQAKFLGTYTSTVSAIVSDNVTHLSHHTNYGVIWLEAEYECDLPYSVDDMEDMLHAIDLAEKNLLLIGMPFTPDYKFQHDQAYRKRRNERLRKMYNLEEREKEDWDDYKRRMREL